MLYQHSAFAFLGHQYFNIISFIIFYYIFKCVINMHDATEVQTVSQIFTSSVH